MANEILPPPTDNLHTIFVDTNIDTHLAMVVSVYDTISDVKAKIGAEHAICFQDIGEIDIQAIKVRRRGFFYNLADSMYVLDAFHGVQSSWFVCIDVVPMCTVKNQKVLTNKVTHEHLKHRDYAVPVCSVDKHQEIVFCGLSPKHSGPDGQGNHNPSIDREYRSTMLIDQEKNDRRKDDCKSLGGEANDAMPSATCTNKTISEKRRKASQQDKLLESQSQHYVVEKKKGKKLKDGFHEEHLEACRRGSKFSRNEDIDESNNSGNVPQEINCDGKKEILATSSQGLLSKLPHENTISLQNPPVEKHTKKRKRKSSKSHELDHLDMPSETVVVRSPQVTADPKNPPVEKHTKKRKRKSSKSHEVDHLDMPSETAVVRSPQVTADPQNSGKEANASFFSGKCPSEPNIEVTNDEIDMSAPHDTASFLELSNQKETSNSMEVNEEPIEEQIVQVNPEDQSERHVNSSQYTNVVVSLKEPAEARVSSQVVSEFPTKLYCKTEGLTSQLPHENTVLQDTISLQNPLVEKHTKKMKRKSSKSHKEAHLVMPYETVVVRSPQLTADPHNLGKEANASIFSGKYPTEPSIEESLPNDERDMSTVHDIANFLEVSNQKESGHSMEINKEPIEEHILQVNPEDLSEKHVNSGQDISVDVSLKEPAEARVSSQVAYEFPTNIYCSTDKFKSQSNKSLEPMEENDQESGECYATKCVTDLNLRSAGSVDAKAGISASAEKFPYQEQTTNAVSNLKGANKDCFFIKVNSKGLRKSQRSRKKSKAESSGVSESIELNGNKDHFISDNAPVSLNDAQNESNAEKFIKQADQKASGGHSVDTMIKISPSSKKVPYQDEVSIMNSGNPRISMPNNLSEVSNAFVEQAAEIRVPSQTSSEVQAKSRRSRKKSKSEPSKLGSQENCDVVLPKFNSEITKSNEERGSDPSKLANDSNQKIELHCMDAKVVENSSKVVEVPQVNPLESSSCRLKDFSEQSNAKIIVKGNVTQYEALAGPTKSKRDRKKSKKETLKAQVSSEMNEPMGLCRPDNSTINFDDYFVTREGKHAVHAVDPPSGKSRTRKKNKTSWKTDINQPYQDSPTNLVQPSSHEQHMAIGQALENDTNHDMVDAVHDTVTKDSKTGIVRKGKNTKQSSKQNSSFDRMESDSSLHKTHDKHKLDKKLQNYEPESQVQLSKSGAMGNKQGKKITADGKGKTQSFAPDHDIDNMVSRDGVRYKDLNSSTISNPVGDAVGSNNFDVSQSEVMASEVASTDSTEDTHQKRRYRVVRKFSSGKSEKITSNSNSEKSLSASSGTIFSDASVTSSESENERYKKKAASVTSSGDSDSHLEKMQTKASALKLRINTNSFGAELDECGEISKEDDGRTKNHSRSDASTQKIPLTFVPKSSISYRKSKLTASQSEFPDAESQPIDVVLETQPESAAP